MNWLYLNNTIWIVVFYCSWILQDCHLDIVPVLIFNFYVLNYEKNLLLMYINPRFCVSNPINHILYHHLYSWIIGPKVILYKLHGELFLWNQILRFGLVLGRLDSLKLMIFLYFLWIFLVAFTYTVLIRKRTKIML